MEKMDKKKVWDTYNLDGGDNRLKTRQHFSRQFLNLNEWIIKKDFAICDNRLIVVI